ncbi:MAG: GFA family protein [Alphaproteobacteria bacterium]|jgi:hypothetical protein|nr:GFA family protein [Alphaproteobacteria bacterium]MDP6589270.1 GFA family protein [Alphaproteobacteria bacterium]MDP6818215.1 GFA family protein [Alphaproteobacteria bacterium]
MDEITLPINGGCLCGAVRYEASEPPHHAEYCHCRMCQRHTGSAVGVYAAIRAGGLRITRGAPKFYKSSDICERGFCADCGSTLMDRYFDPDDPYIWVGVGSLDHPEYAPPNQHFGIESQLPWLTIDDDLPRAHSENDPGFIAGKAAVDQDGR